MSRVAFCLVLLGLPSFAYSQYTRLGGGITPLNIRECLAKIEQMNKPGGAPACELSIPKSDWPNPLDGACIEALCPNGSGQVDTILDSISEGELPVNIRDKLLKSYFESVAAEIQSDLASLKNLQDQLKSGKPFSAESSILANGIFSSITNISKLSINVDGSINESASFDAMIANGDSRDELEATKRMHNIYEGQSRRRKSLLLQSAALAMAHLSPHELQRQISLVHGDLLRDVSAISKAMSVPPNLIINSDLIAGALAQRLLGGRYTTVDLEDLSHSSSFIEILAVAVRDPKLKQLLPKAPVQLEKILDQDFVKKISERIEFMEAYLANSSDIDQEKLSAIVWEGNNCAIAAARAQALWPSAKQIQDFKGIEEEWRLEFQNALGKIFSTATSKALKGLSRRWKMVPPEPAEKFSNNIIGRFERRKTSFMENFNTIKGLSNDSKESNSAVLVAQLKAGGVDAFAESSVKVCKEAWNAMFNDSATLKSDELNLSPLTIRFPERGRAVAFHEYGHKLSLFVRSKNASKISREATEKRRLCLASLHDGSEKYVEEDWADMISAAAGGENKNCYWVSPREGLSLANSNTKDSHSSGFFRTLHHHLTAGQSVPAVCQDAMKAKGEEIKVKSCL